ncbi:DUF5810 domain-containing protein [Halorientalis regularis]|jgi:hypothetical protein|uniref:Uncharacterized protein n=1 Tax=Halorientalis regularis TaxID=660518 RepID=A0A1G7L1J9_9EURY|nr:DUF5810 domain-containing protein [Halorientalis regularis]SDF43358.1 hypothetical protein SAMN05216218_106124 [Halorientalis regularis]
MGYACPVCEDPQADAEHLANHLAFTALLGDDDHEAWLDDHAPDWDQADADALAATVTEIAEETDYPQVFEDTVEHDHDHERSGALFEDESRAVERGRERASQMTGLDDEDEEILEEAREMTRQMQDGEDERSESSDFVSGAEPPASEGESDGDEDATDSETE